MTVSKTTLVLAGFAAAALAAGPSLAHHSFAMFDMTKDVSLEGTVKEFQWTNPHSWVQVVVQDPAGKDVEWSIELGGPSNLFHKGWTRNSIKPGDKIAMVIHPLRNGAAGGAMVSVAVNGQKLGGNQY